MFPVSRRRRAERGFTLIESMVALAVMSITLALGVRAMSGWVQASKARDAGVFYAEGLALARQQAMAHNASSRFQLTRNDANGQYDWQVDICFPTLADNCDANSAGWSATDAVAAADPDQANGFRSVKRLASSLPKSEVMAASLAPLGNDAIYFASTGWVDTNIDERMTTITFTPGAGFETTIRPSAIVVGLAGTANQCDPAVVAPDSRACPI